MRISDNIREFFDIPKPKLLWPRVLLFIYCIAGAVAICYGIGTNGSGG